MGPHADKGLLVTTERFSAGARRAAVEAGFPPIDLIDGDEFIVRIWGRYNIEEWRQSNTS